jgi:hypothetical protein
MKTLQKNGLEKLVSLSENVKIYIPSTINVDEKIDNGVHVETVRNALNECFGGSTAYNAIGSWFSDNLQKNVIEGVAIVQSFTDKLDNEKIDFVLQVAKTLCNEMKQECVSIEINNVLYFIEGGEI